MPVSGQLKSVKIDGGTNTYEIEITCDLGSVTLIYNTKNTSLDAGREEARQKLYALGSELATAFQNSQSLR